MLSNLVGILLNLNVLDKIVSVYFLLGLLRDRLSNSLLSPGARLDEQISVALFESLHLKVAVVYVQLIFDLVLILLRDREVILVVVELQVEAIEVFHSSLGLGLGFAIPLNTETQRQVLDPPHSLRHVEVWSEVTRLLIFLDIRLVEGILNSLSIAAAVQLSDELLLERLLDASATVLLALINDRIRWLLSIHGSQALVRELEDAALKVVHFTLLGRSLLALLPTVGVELIDSVGVQSQADVEVLGFRHSFESVFPPVCSNGLLFLMKALLVEVTAQFTAVEVVNGLGVAIEVESGGILGIEIFPVLSLELGVIVLLVARVV